MSELKTETTEGVLEITFNRPEKKNALTLNMYSGIVAALERAGSDDSVRVVLFTGQGDAFTSGNDILDFMNAPPTGPESPVARFLEFLLTFEKPMLAAVNGSAVGIGVTMLLYCDMVFLAACATLRMPFVDLALCPEAGSSYLLPRIMGLARASELLLLSKKVGAVEAARLGLANAVFDDDGLLDEVRTIARTLAKKPPASVRATRRLLRHGTDKAIREQIAEEAPIFISSLGSPEAAEAFTAFLEKREPDFSKF
jgi:enoyl-CoA hydratase/carnithine racemase